MPLRRLDEFGLILSGAVPMLACIEIVSAEGEWGTADHMIAGGLELTADWPLLTPILAAASRFPMGPLQVRLVLAHSALLSVACLLIFAAVRTLLRIAGVTSPRTGVPLALGTTWLVAATLLVSGLRVGQEPLRLLALAVALQWMLRPTRRRLTALALFGTAAAASATAVWVLRPTLASPVPHVGAPAHTAVMLGMLVAATLARAMATRRPLASLDDRPLLTLLGLATGLLAVSGLHEVASAEAARDARFHSITIDRMRDECPPRSVLITQLPVRATAWASAEARERLRPDVQAFYVRGQLDIRHMPKHGTLHALLRTYLLSGELSDVELQSLAARRPVRIEMHPYLSPTLYESLAPTGLLYGVVAGVTTRQDVRGAAEQQRRTYLDVARHFDLGRLEPSSRALWSFGHYADAVYYLERDDREAAAFSLEFAEAAGTRAGLLEALHTSIGRIDAEFDVNSFRVLWTDFLPAE